jgi:alpha-beta hydrolase superfamily lysophospholipase
MLQAIDTRELISLDILGYCLRGTFHRPAGDTSVSWSLPASALNRAPGGPAVLFLNSLALPRAAAGDSAVYWADAFALRGYPTFRFDLPGLGDSDGHASTDLLDVINTGGLAPATAAIAKELVGRGGYFSIILVGHCAGAVTAIFAAAAFKKCKGLILLDPYFHLPVINRPETRKKLSDWARRSTLGKFLSNLYDRARHLWLLLRGSTLPRNANTALLGKWKELSAAGIPVLLFQAARIKAQVGKPRVGEFDYTQHISKLAARKNNLAVKPIDRADHSFANRAGREVVRDESLAFLANNFPLPNTTSRTK